MTVDSQGRALFIVDNSVSGWTGLRYLEEWSGIAKAFDIATGYFEIGALLALDGKWQGLDKIRILMGAETTHRTRKAILEAVRAQALGRLDESIEEDKEPNPFLHGVPAILEALRFGQIECRVYDKDKFHAKAYITHATLEVVGAQALVGSSNFTRPGLTKNVELNVQIQSAREVAQLQEWFETHWNDAKEVTEAVIETISRHTHLYTPFDVYAKALQQFFRGHELTATEWDETRSRMFPHLDRYQKEAYWALMKIARQHRGAFLCDGVGLGKTFVGLMLIERLILHEGKRVVLFAPKAAKEAVWEPHLSRLLPHIGGVGGGADFSNLAVFVELKAAAGGFSDPQYIDDNDFEWVAVETRHRLRKGMFVAQVVGKSMEPRIPDGAWCLFRAPVEGTRQGKTVLVQLRDDTDPETDQRYTVKRYKSEKTVEGNSWRHVRITLDPVNPEFEPIVIASADEGEIQVIAELVEVLEG